MPNFDKLIADVATVLDAARVPYTVNPLFDGSQLRFPWSHGDVACHSGTYSSRAGYVETYMFPWDEGDVSVLRPAQAAQEIIEYYHKIGEN